MMVQCYIKKGRTPWTSSLRSGKRWGSGPQVRPLMSGVLQLHHTKHLYVQLVNPRQLNVITKVASSRRVWRRVVASGTVLWSRDVTSSGDNFGPDSSTDGTSCIFIIIYFYPSPFITFLLFLLKIVYFSAAAIIVSYYVIIFSP